MHIRVSQNEVHLRVTPRGTDKYRWEVEKGNIALHRIFNPKRTISKLSKPECLLLSQEVGNSFRAVGTLGISLGEAASLEAKVCRLLAISGTTGNYLLLHDWRLRERMRRKALTYFPEPGIIEAISTTRSFTTAIWGKVRKVIFSGQRDQPIGKWIKRRCFPVATIAFTLAAAISKYWRHSVQNWVVILYRISFQLLYSSTS